MENRKFRHFMMQASVALIVALMMLAPIATPMTAAVTGRVYEEVVEEEVKCVHQSPTQVRRGRHKRQNEPRKVLPLQARRKAPEHFESLAKPLCFWFSPPPLLRAPPALV